MEITVSLRQGEDGRWVGVVPDGQAVPSVLTKAGTREECLEKVRRSLDRTLSEDGAIGPLTLLVDVTPRLAGVAEAAQIMGWDKRRVITYISRGRFPEPVQALASGRVWTRSTIEQFAREWNARQAKRKRRGPAPGEARGDRATENTGEGAGEAVHEAQP